MNAISMLAEERTASIRDIQKNPSAALRGVTRVMRGSETIGFFLSNEYFLDLVEDTQARKSKTFVKYVAASRRATKKTKGTSLAALAAEYGI